jgi:hypothetical protein
MFLDQPISDIGLQTNPVEHRLASEVEVNGAFASMKHESRVTTIMHSG